MVIKTGQGVRNFLRNGRFTFGVHNGKDFIEVIIKEEMVGHRLGEFSLSRKFIRHGGKMQREIEGGAAPVAGAAPAAKPAEKNNKNYETNNRKIESSAYSAKKGAVHCRWHQGVCG